MQWLKSSTAHASKPVGSCQYGNNKQAATFGALSWSEICAEHLMPIKENYLKLRNKGKWWVPASTEKHLEALPEGHPVPYEGY